MLEKVPPPICPLGLMIITIVLVLVNVFHLGFCETEISININSNYCMTYYPYTYSKCLQICSPTLESTCLDDQLCFCNSVYKYKVSDELENFQLFGVDKNSKCESSKFCQDACRDASADYPGLNFSKGILCSSQPDQNYYTESVKSCVCSL